MFTKLEPSRLKLLAFTSEALTFESGEILFYQGDPADAAYVIMQGEVEILVDTDTGQVVMGVLGANELFGELGVLTKAPRVSTLRAKGELHALRITDEMFVKFLAENAQVALDVMRQLSVKVARTQMQYEEVRRELARYESSSS